jgi:hypothetical protein
MPDNILNSDGGSTDQKHFYARYGTEDYYFFLALYNNEGYEVFLQRNAVMHLEIDDNIFNPFSSATMILANDQHVLEKTKNSYVFLGNGRDIVDIEIVPIKTGIFDTDAQNEQNKEYLGLKFQFVVIESVDIIYNNTMCKKLTLVEYAQYMLNENICNIFDLQKYGGSVGNPIETIGANSVSTGDAIKAILCAVYTKDGKVTDDIIYTDPSTKAKVFESDPATKLFLSPHGLMSYMEVLNYVLSFHSYQKSPCILQLDRYYKTFQLISLRTLFQDNEKHCIETFRFPSPSQYVGSESGGGTDSPAIIWNIFPITFEESRINEFYISSPTTKYNVHLASSNGGILSNARSFKCMIFNTTTLNSDSFVSDFTELFIKPFKDNFIKTGSNNKYKVVPNFYINPNKKNNYDTLKGYLAPELDESRFLNQKLSSLLYLNNVYQFKLNGKTHRKSMAFVDVVKTAENQNGTFVASKWDRNNLGRHLITKVKHIFTFDRYLNEVETIKPYRLLDDGEEETSAEPNTINNLLTKK